MADGQDEEKMPAPDILPVSAADVLASQPPPSYEEAMGQYVTSLPPKSDVVDEDGVAPPDDLPPLTFIDIMPRMTNPGIMANNIPPTFEKFSDIMRGANMWLAANPGLRVWRCETVERKVNKGERHAPPTVHLDSTLHHESAYGANTYVSGLRLWLTRRSDPSDGVQELCLLNVPPPTKEVPVTLAYGGFGGFAPGMPMMDMHPMMSFGLGRRRGPLVMTEGHILTYEGLGRAVESFNQAMKESPLDGSILSVETTPIKFGDGHAGDADPDVTSWSETGKAGKAFSTRRFTTIIRVFYIKGPPRGETLSMETFMPEVIKEPEWNRAAQFAPYDNVLARAQQWLQSRTGIRVVSLETRDAECNAGYGQRLTFTEDSTDNVVTSVKDRNMAHYLRIFYVSAPPAASYAQTTLTSHLFVPQGLGGRRFETMTQTMTRVNHWLCTVGLPPFSVETVPLLLTSGGRVETSKPDFKHSTRNGNFWLACVRLYFPAPFQPPVLAPTRTSDSSSCVIV